VQSYNGTGTNNRTDSGFNNPDHYTIQDMKTLLDISIVFIFAWALYYVMLTIAFPFLANVLITHLIDLEWTFI